MLTGVIELSHRVDIIHIVEVKQRIRMINRKDGKQRFKLSIANDDDLLLIRVVMDSM